MNLAAEQDTEAAVRELVSIYLLKKGSNTGEERRGVAAVNF